MSAQPRSLGELLRRYRLAAGLSQDALAARAGVSRRGVSAIERGLIHTPHRDTVARLADALALDTPERTMFAASARGHWSQPVAPLQPPSGADAAQLTLVGREHELALIALPTSRRVRSRTLSSAGPEAATIQGCIRSGVRSALRDEHEGGAGRTRRTSPARQRRWRASSARRPSGETTARRRAARAARTAWPGRRCAGRRQPCRGCGQWFALIDHERLLPDEAS
jgi:transcriptional regulator with XRE-family HTH domain